MDLSSLDCDSAGLIQTLAKGGDINDLGSTTIAIYDTAWLAMVSRTIHGEFKWQFPECFQYLLETQAADGTWTASHGLDDQIMNTMAALLALKKHVGIATCKDCVDQKDLEDRIMRATFSLQGKLQDWDVESCMHVGFEILIPAMIEMLEEEGLSFNPPGSFSLALLKEKKLSQFKPELLYRCSSTFLHSLEGLIGKIDFDKVRHHRNAYGMLASPASTAAFLMNASMWNNEAEIYLRKVILESYGHGNGGVPSIFPTPVFEITWVSLTRC